MDTKELLKKVRQIEIKTKKQSNDILTGSYHSAFKGKGLTFSEVRPYTYGDDIRRIDWKVTARLSEPHVKIMEEERELTILLLVDHSTSMSYGTKNAEKSDYVAEIAALITLSALKNNDKVGLITFTDKVEKVLKPAKGRFHALKIIRELVFNNNISPSSSINEAIQYVNKVFKKRTIIFLISDFMIDDYNEKHFRKLCAYHDVTAIRVQDPIEIYFPPLGYIKVTDIETNTSYWINLNKKNVQSYIEYRNKKNEHVKKMFQKFSAGFIDLTTNDNYLKSLIKYFSER
ncbi:MAG: DUF58 domain-containing protein [Thermaurantimonas sp.]|uniref:DUF58 domain-containing protein n=1 Tax=Thermaurantimonas sp. TaxID=2681568 RepID=UPI0039197BFB